ncbi:lysosomal protective protein-like isoform X2 [Amblyomma americanum]
MADIRHRKRYRCHHAQEASEIPPEDVVCGVTVDEQRSTSFAGFDAKSEADQRTYFLSNADQGAPWRLGGATASTWLQSKRLGGDRLARAVRRGQLQALFRVPERCRGSEAALLVANVIFLESPAGVGYSYDPTGVYVTNDTKTTEDNYLAVLDFFEKFPEFKENEFYITGESYAGVYIPLLVRRFLHDSRGVNLKGFAIGNGALDYELHGKGIIFFGYYHALFGDDLWDQITSNCCNNSISKDTCDFGWTTTDPACTEPVSIAYDIYLNRGLNLYNLYVPCGTVEGLPTSLSSRHPEVTSQYASKELLRKILRLPTSMEKTNSASPNCYNQDHLLLYYNRRDVIEALHVEESPLRWVPCTDTLNYTQQYETVREVVRELIDSDRLRALIYNGDVDMACPFLSNGWFVRSLGVTPTSVYKMWHTGTAIPVISGFVQTFTKNVTFATVLGAGHKAPMDKPAEALHMITNFLSQTPLE